jgi:hypothetical protein
LAEAEKKIKSLKEMRDYSLGLLGEAEIQLSQDLEVSVREDLKILEN